MNLSEFSVKNWQFMLVMFVGVVALGLNSLFNMPRSEDPIFEAPTFVITVIYPGTDPKDMEELVVDPVEKRLNELKDVNNIRTTIDDGLAVFMLEYEYGVDNDEKKQEVAREVNSMRGILPNDIFDIRYFQFDPGLVNIVQVALVSEVASYKELADYSEKLRKVLEKNKDLRSVKDFGFPKENVRISLNVEKMAQEGIALNRVLGALQAENLNIPAGSVQEGARRFNVKTSGDYESLDQIRSTIVATNGQKIIYLGDVAEVDFNYEDETNYTRLNGSRAVLVVAAQKAGKNITETGKKLNATLTTFEKGMPKHIKMVKYFDQSVSVDRRLDRFAKDFGIAILLVALTLLPLGFRAALVVMISIPLSLAIGLTAVHYLGYSINQLSVVGLIVALGILVDDSIVVVENIERWMRDGYSKRDAAVKATKQITLAVIGCTVTLILAFLPLIFLPEASGDFIRSLPTAVVTTILASMLVSLTIVPFLSSRLLENNHNPEGNLFLRALKKLISGSYSRLLNWALRHPFPTLLVAGLLFGASLTIPKIIGFGLFPKSEKPMFRVTLETPEGSTLDETNRSTRLIENELKTVPEVKFFTSSTGRGVPRMYYNVIERSESSNYAEVFVQLQDEIHPPEKEKVIERLRERLRYIPNANVEVVDFEQGPNTEAPIAIRVMGEDLDKLRNVAADVEKILKATPGTIYVKNPLTTRRTDLRVKINKEKAGMLGVSIADINRTVRLAIAGLNIGSYKDSKGDDYNINVTLPKGKTTNSDILKNLYVNTLTGASIPLRQVADIEFEVSTNQIRHYDRDRFVTISAFVKNGYLVDNVYKEVINKLEKYQFPQDFTYKAAGELEAREKSFGGLGTIILITAFGFIGVLILEFGTFKSSLIVLSVIPLGIIGAFTMLWIVGYPLSFIAVIGLIALIGIEVKNSILLVDFTNQLREEGLPLLEAIQEAGEIRFVPIVLTSLTAIGGLIPLAIEANPLYSPLAWVLIGGLISSTLLSRIVTPVLYRLIPPKVEVKNT
ncbi:efflux RND transporter permease subunit [Runella sp. MFBS21]|uniref:efflux RND transporter permease subunit n=1 Tax=Runella sp. MFBS21 TaxID=3034018 RepID=UPI0023F861C8|nr:efflux RND transporter permease subunit [Runella sp. MFBS21]MDF7818168.1 efflux RND transporter permease subunit [Runella sp. MFBS21]